MTPPTEPFTAEKIGDLGARTAVVTGPSLGGLGHHTALELARHGARVLIAGRNATKVSQTADAIRAEVPAARVEQVALDLASRESVTRASHDILARVDALDLLVNNAGVMAPPHQLTPDGLEVQMATNHFGPFLLSGLLLPALSRSPDARVVTVSSQLHRLARRAPLADPRRHDHTHRRWTAYGESKLANLLFTYELERRLRDAGLPIRALAAHPGMAGTHLAVNSQVPVTSRLRASVLDGAIAAISQSAARGALPTLWAATGDLPGATYVGPRGPGELAGTPTLVTASRVARDEDAQRRLWQLSEEVVGLRWP